MPALSSLALAFFETPITAKGNELTLLTWEVGIIAAFFLILIAVLLIGIIYVLKLVREIKQKGAELERRGEQILADITAKVTPFVDKAHEMMEDVAPKIKSVTSDVEAISRTVRTKVEEVGVTVSQVNGTVQDANAKTRNQVARVDTIVTGALNTTHEISNKIQAGIRYPVNQMAGWVAGLKAGFETLAQRSPWMKGKAKPGPYDL